MAPHHRRAGARRRRIGEIPILREARVSQTKVGDGTDRQQQIVALSDLWRARMPTLHPARTLRLRVSKVGCGAFFPVAVTRRERLLFGRELPITSPYLCLLRMARPSREGRCGRCAVARVWQGAARRYRAG